MCNAQVGGFEGFRFALHINSLYDLVGFVRVLSKIPKTNH
jgi:hypothetical protein